MVVRRERGRERLQRGNGTKKCRGGLRISETSQAREMGRGRCNFERSLLRLAANVC